MPASSVSLMLKYDVLAAPPGSACVVAVPRNVFGFCVAEEYSCTVSPAVPVTWPAIVTVP